MQTISLTEALSVSERYQDVHLRLFISVGVHPTEEYSAIGTHFDSMKLGSLPYEAVDAIFFRGIADGVTEGW
jgi:hypothetical protein